MAFLNGEVHGRPRQLLLDQLKAGNIDLLIGTHALFSKDVEYRNLRYVIIDEQHRFGVEQRRALLEKGIEPDVLLMTATPIPRTLALTVFGNLNVSTIRTMPKGRLPVITYLVDDSKRDKMYEAVGVEMKRGHQAYFVYPRIDDEGNSDLRDVESMYRFLSTEKYPSFRGTLIHSRLPEEEKIEILNDFAAGKLDYLVSTSVVEVGIDVPNATCKPVKYFYEYCEKNRWKGNLYYEKYSTAQLNALRELLKELCRRHSIPSAYSNDMWVVSTKALRGEPGIYGHCSYRFDKSDVHPQPELINMLKQL